MLALEHRTHAGHPVPSRSRQQAGQATFAVTSDLWQMGASSQEPTLDARLPSRQSNPYHAMHCCSIAEDNVFWPLGRITYSFVKCLVLRPAPMMTFYKGLQDISASKLQGF